MKMIEAIPLAPQPEQTVELVQASKILSIRNIGEHMFMYVLADTESQITRTAHIEILVAGQEVPLRSREFLDTVVLGNRAFHVFEIVGSQLLKG